MNVQEFQKMITKLNTIYGEQLNKQQLQIYFDNLKKIKSELVNETTNNVIKNFHTTTTKRYPEISDILKNMPLEASTVGGRFYNYNCNCRACKDTGRVLYRQKDKKTKQEYEYAAYCNCQEGMNYKDNYKICITEIIDPEYL